MNFSLLAGRSDEALDHRALVRAAKKAWLAVQKETWDSKEIDEPLDGQA